MRVTEARGVSEDAPGVLPLLLHGLRVPLADAEARRDELELLEGNSGRSIQEGFSVCVTVVSYLGCPFLTHGYSLLKHTTVLGRIWHLNEIICLD